MIVFGGNDDKPRESIIILDLKKSQWSKFTPSDGGGVESSAPGARDFHSAVMDS